jgi:hypothetical protein
MAAAWALYKTQEKIVQASSKQRAPGVPAPCTVFHLCSQAPSQAGRAVAEQHGIRRVLSPPPTHTHTPCLACRWQSSTACA